MFDFYLQYEYWFAAVQLVLAMLGMGATLTVGDFKQVLRQPRSFTLGLVLQLVGVPAIAALLITSIDMDPGLAVGLALCAAIPGGTVSNILTYFGRGHIALSIALTGVATLACLITTPIVLSLLIARHMPADFTMPSGRIALEIGLCLLVPLAAGMVYLRALPRSAPHFSTWCIRGSLFTILLIVVGAAGAGRLDIEAFGVANLLIVVGFTVVLAVTSALIPRMLGASEPDVAAINIEITVRNTNLGLLIKASLFPAVVGVADPVGDNVLFTVLLYGAVMLIIGAGLVFTYRHRIPPTPAAAPGPAIG